MATQDGQILSLQTVKDRLEIEHSAHDDLLGEFIEEAEAEFESWTRTPIAARTFTEYHDGGTDILLLKRRPVDADSVTVTDTLGTKVDETDDEEEEEENFRVDEEAGLIYRTTDNGARMEWEKGVRRHKVQYDAGHSAGEDWDAWSSARIRRSLRRLVCGWYENVPGIREERTGPISVSYESLDIPDDVKAAWGRRVRV